MSSIDPQETSPSTSSADEQWAWRDPRQVAAPAPAAAETDDVSEQQKDIQILKAGLANRRDPELARRSTQEASVPNPQISYTETSRHIGRKILGATLALSVVGGLVYDVGLNEHRGLEAISNTVIGWLPAGASIASEHKAGSATPNVDTTTPEPETSTSQPTTHATRSTPTSKPTKQVVVPIVPKAETCVDKLPDATLIAQKIMAPVDADNLKAMTPVFDERHVGGAILMPSQSNPLKNPADGSIIAFKKSQSISIEFATDQEGGDPTVKTTTGISRIKVPVTKLEPKGYLPTAAEMAKMKPDQITELVAENYGSLKPMGIDTSFGTVVDVAPIMGTTKIGASRIASSDPTTVITYAASYVAGAELAGVNTVLKHGGMGSASANTDTSPAIAPNITALKLRDFTVYTALRAAGLKVDGMIGSEAIPGLTIDAGKDKKLGTVDDIKTPASLSLAAVSLFKTDYLSKNAKTYTDDLGAPGIAVNRTVTEASIDAWKAGVDVGLFVHTSLVKGTSNKMTVAQQLDDTIEAGVAVMKNNTLPRAEVVSSVTRILGAKHVGACALLKQVNPNAYKTLTLPVPKKAPSTPAPVSTTAIANATATGKQTAIVKQTTKITASSK